MPTFGNLSESATHNRDSCHLLKLSLVRERSRARYFCIGPAHQRGMVQQACSLLVFKKGDADMQTSSDRHTAQIFGLAMGAVFAAMLILNAVSY